MILDEILEHKRAEVEKAKSNTPARNLRAMLGAAPTPRGFAKALKRADGRIGLIAEVKKASPSAGVIRVDFDPAKIAAEYAAAGADCLSVLTDSKYFQGSLTDMSAARLASGLPVLRKDFVVDEYQIFEARAAGADAILLIAAALNPDEIADFQSIGWELGMDVLVETHDELEMEIALEAGATLIGINSRNLQTFETDLATIERLAPMAAGTPVVGESGIKTAADVARLAAVGVKAILVGETLMRAGDVAAGVLELVG